MAITCSFKIVLGQVMVSVLAACALLGVQLHYFATWDTPARFAADAQDGLLHLTTVQAEETVLESGPQRSVHQRYPQEVEGLPLELVSGHHKTQVYRVTHRHGDLPPLTPDRSPDSETWDNSVAICSTMLHENSTDVREWLLYHKWLGVDHVYLTENSDPPPEHLVSQLQDFIDDGFVTFNSVGTPGAQKMIYHDCMKQHHHKHNWLAFIDLDEFIVLRRPDTTLKEYLDEFKHEPALVIHWILVGSSGMETRPTYGGVLRHYTKCDKSPSTRVKSIANTWFLINASGNVHTFEYKNNLMSVDENHRKMPWRDEAPKPCLDGTISNPLDVVDCRPIPNYQKMNQRTVNDIAVFHYVTRSKEDFAIKMARGGGAKRHRDWRYFNKIDSQAGSSGGICDDAAKLAHCCSEDQYSLPVAAAQLQDGD